MSSADILRTPGLAQALQDGADALDQVVQLTATIDGLETSLSAATQRIADLEAQIAALQPTPAPQTTAFGVNASSTAQHASNAALFAPAAWRYYQQVGEPITWPKEYPLGTGEAFAYSDKVPIPDKVAGKADAAFTAWCKAAPTDRDTIYCPLHEHDAKIAQGLFTNAQYVQAFQRLAAIAHATNPRVKMTVIYTDWCLKPASKRNWKDTWPGDAADLFGVDAYVSPSYTPLANMPTMFDAAIAAATSVGKPWALFETGVDNRAYTGQQRLDALTALAKLIRAKGARIACYFNLSNWTLTAAEAAAWKAGQG